MSADLKFCYLRNNNSTIKLDINKLYRYYTTNYKGCAKSIKLFDYGEYQYYRWNNILFHKIISYNQESGIMMTDTCYFIEESFLNKLIENEIKLFSEKEYCVKTKWGDEYNLKNPILAKTTYSQCEIILQYDELMFLKIKYCDEFNIKITFIDLQDSNNDDKFAYIHVDELKNNIIELSFLVDDSL